MTNTPTRQIVRKPAARIPASRWTAYVTAGAASALACVSETDANIYHFNVNESFDGFGQTTGGFPNVLIRQFLLQPGAYLTFLHATDAADTKGNAGFYLGAPSARIVGVNGTFNGNPYAYVAKLGFGQSIANKAFIGNVPNKFGALASNAGYPNSQWAEAGKGYIGFKFNVGSGTQYGWVQLVMNGPNLNTYELIDYAFADPGQKLHAGQVPETGSSLSMLALGAVGLLLWRKKRAAV